jgi:hypothetical protein
MQKIVITSGCCFGLPKDAYDMLCSLGCEEALEDRWVFEEDLNNIKETYPDDVYQKFYEDYNYNIMCVKRDDPLLVQVVEQYDWSTVRKSKRLKVVEIPDDVEWYVYEADDGQESVHEEHRVWR